MVVGMCGGHRLLVSARKGIVRGRMALDGAWRLCVWEVKCIGNIVVRAPVNLLDALMRQL